jgi:3-oxoadipate enol-lactonase
VIDQVVQLEDGVGLAYDDVGQGAAVIFVNGLGNLKEAWRETVASVSRYGRAITYNFRNQGLVNREHGDDYLVVQHVRDLQALVASTDVASFVGVGISTGARILMDYAFQYPERVRGLVLMGASNDNLGPRYQMIFSSWIRLLDTCPSDDLTAYVNAYLPWIFGPNYVAEHADLATQIGQLLLRTQTISGTRANLKSLVRSYDLAHAAKTRGHRVASRILFLQGEYDFLTPPGCLQQALTQYPNAQLRIIRGSGHNVRVEKPQEFEDALIGFLLEDDDF